MKQKLPSLPTFSALMLSAILTVWLGLWGPISVDGVARWQTLIAAVIAGAGIFAASWNVTRQMRLAASGREQDRIELEQPGLRDAAAFIGPLMIVCIMKTDMLPGTILKILVGAGITDNTQTNQIIETKLPRTPDGMRRILSGILFNISHLASLALSFAEHDDGSQEMERFHKDALHSLGEAVKELDAYNGRLKDMIAKNEERLPRLRADIEQFFRD
jgi:hypothetical protein